jgi:hypothetical protein
MTNDFIEDAADLLDQSDEPYIIIVGRGNSMIFTSNVGGNNIKILEEWLISGHWNQMLEDHLKKIK